MPSRIPNWAAVLKVRAHPHNSLVESHDNFRVLVIDTPPDDANLLVRFGNCGFDVGIEVQMRVHNDTKMLVLTDGGDGRSFDEVGPICILIEKMQNFALRRIESNHFSDQRSSLQMSS